MPADDRPRHAEPGTGQGRGPGRDPERVGAGVAGEPAVGLGRRLGLDRQPHDQAVRRPRRRPTPSPPTPPATARPSPGHRSCLARQDHHDDGAEHDVDLVAEHGEAGEQPDRHHVTGAEPGRQQHVGGRQEQRERQQVDLDAHAVEPEAERARRPERAGQRQQPAGLRPVAQQQVAEQRRSWPRATLLTQATILRPSDDHAQGPHEPQPLRPDGVVDEVVRVPRPDAAVVHGVEVGERVVGEGRDRRQRQRVDDERRRPRSVRLAQQQPQRRLPSEGAGLRGGVAGCGVAVAVHGGGLALSGPGHHCHADALHLPAEA